MARISKDQGINISLSTVATLVVIVPAIWFVLQPILVSSVGTALAQETREIVKEEIAPVINSFEVLLQRDITNLRIQIARMEFRQGQNTDWTQEDAELLVTMRIELNALEMALEELVAVEEEE